MTAANSLAVIAALTVVVGLSVVVVPSANASPGCCATLRPLKWAFGRVEDPSIDYSRGYDVYLSYAQRRRA
jgi:hypothetical protein